MPVNTTRVPQAATVKTEARTIDQSISLALKHPTLMSSEARRQQAQSNLSVAKANRWFTLSGDAEAGAQHYDDEGDRGSAGVGAIGLSLNQPLIDGGRRRGAVLTAAEGLAAASENLAWQQRQRTYIAAQAHINMWLAQELVRNNADNVAQLENIVTEVRARLTHAESTVTELAEAESRLATARAIQAERITALGAAQASYLRDVGETASTVAAPGEGPQEELGSYGLHPLVQAAQHAVSNRKVSTVSAKPATGQHSTCAVAVHTTLSPEPTARKMRPTPSSPSTSAIPSSITAPHAEKLPPPKPQKPKLPPNWKTPNWKSSPHA